MSALKERRLSQFVYGAMRALTWSRTTGLGLVGTALYLLSYQDLGAGPGVEPGASWL